MHRLDEHQSSPIARVKVSLLQEILKSVDASGVVVLSGYRDYPNAIPSDVDLIGTKDVLLKLKSLVTSGEFHAVQILQHESTCYYWVFYRIVERGRPVFLQFDFALDYRRDGRVYYRAEELLPHRRRKSGLPLLPAALEFGYYMVKKIGKGSLEQRHAVILSELFEQDPLGGERELTRFLPPAESHAILRAAQGREWDGIRSRLPQIRRAMLRKMMAKHPWDTVMYRLGDVLRGINRILQPTGLVVVILGPDGSGKSTIAEHITRDLLPAFRRTRIVHLRPSLRRRTGSGPVTDPHGQPSRGLPASLAKIFYWWGETLLGWLVDIQPAKIRSTFVAFDRYYHDILADPKRYRFGGPLWLARLVGYLIPKPDLFLILDLPAEVAHARKSEVLLEDARRLRGRYLELAKSLPTTHVVDASRPVDEVVAEAEGVILKFLEQRTRERL